MRRKLIFIVSAAGLLLSTVLMIRDLTTSRSITKYELERNEEGGGERDETLEYELNDGSKGEVTLTIPESLYTVKEVEQLLNQALDQLDSVILGDNESWNYINKNLDLPAALPESPVIISWNSSRMDMLDYEGLLSTQIPTEGIEVELTAELSLQGETADYQRTVKVFPPNPEDFSEKLKEAAFDKNHKLEGNLYYLPESIDGQKINWNRKHSTQGITLFFLTLIGIAAIYAAEKQEKNQVRERHREQMMEDYPEIVSKFLLLMSAGLSIRNCFERIAMDNEKRHKTNPSEVHVVYEEMIVTCREMKSGTPELNAYENFGKRCDCPAYKTLSTLLSQNLKKGSKGMMELLEREAQAAFENRKRQARIKGDKAGTKLLLPMIIMLGIVLVILIVPAYLSMMS